MRDGVRQKELRSDPSVFQMLVAVSEGRPAMWQPAPEFICSRGADLRACKHQVLGAHPKAPRWPPPRHQAAAADSPPTDWSPTEAGLPCVPPTTPPRWCSDAFPPVEFLRPVISATEALGATAKGAGSIRWTLGSHVLSRCDHAVTWVRSGLVRCGPASSQVATHHNHTFYFILLRVHRQGKT